MPDTTSFGPLVHFEESVPRPIPSDIVPGILGEYAAAVAEAIQVPFELPLINALGAVAAVAQRKFCVQMHEGYTEPLNIFALAVLPPGERKSAVKDACRFPLLEWEQRQQQLTAAALTQAQAERQVQEEMQRVLLTSAKKCQSKDDRQALAAKIAQLKNEAPRLPASPRLLADDATPEALAALMAQQGQRIAMLEAEGGFFDTLSGRYSNGVPNLDAVLKAWSGEALRIDRRHAEPILLDNPTLTLILSAQPDVLTGLAQHASFRGRGLLGRMLFLLPRSRVGFRNIETFPVAVGLQQSYARMLHHLLEMPWNVGEGDQPIPYVLHLHPEAKAAWFTFAAMIEQALAEGQHLAHMRDWGGKLPGQVLRLAGLCHLSLHQSPQMQSIDGHTMACVLHLAELLTEHAKAAYGLMGADEAIECAKALLTWLRREQPRMFTGRDALEKVKGRWGNMRKVNAGLAALEERGFVLLQEKQERMRGRPSQVFWVNPLLYGVKP